MITPPIDYLIARTPMLPSYSGKLYEFVLAGNGLWKRAMNDHLGALVPVVRFQVPGLPQLEPTAAILRNRLRVGQLLAMLEDAKRMSRNSPVEAMWQAVAVGDGQLRIWRPGQVGSAGAIQYRNGAPGPVVAAVHSHHEMRAFFSPTDDGDETGLGFYAVLGRIFTAPEVRVRVGVYGTFWDCPATALFQSLGPIREARGGARGNKRDIQHAAGHGGRGGPDGEPAGRADGTHAAVSHGIRRLQRRGRQFRLPRLGSGDR